jgi:hypothetical protein
MLGNVTAITTVEVILPKHETAAVGSNIWNTNSRQADKIRARFELCFVWEVQMKCSFFYLMFMDPCIIVYFHKENPTRCNSLSKFYFIFIGSSTCFGRHTAHYQEPKTALTASGFAYVEGWWTCSCWTLSGRVYLTVQQLHIQQPSTYAKPEAVSAVLGSWWWVVCRPKLVELHINMK